MKPRRVLVVRIGAMGDVLHALPAVTALRRDRPDWEIDWVIDSRWAPLLVRADGSGPVVSAVHRADTRLWSRAPFSARTARSILQLRHALRAAHFDHVVDLQGTLRSAVIARFPESSRPNGYLDPREPIARRLYGTKIQRRGTHVVDQGAALLGDALGLALVPAIPELPYDPVAELWAEGLPFSPHGRNGLAVLAPTAGWGAKQWPASRFGSLARKLHDQGWTVLVNTSAVVDPVCAAVVQASGGVATAIPSTVSQLIALLRRATLVVGGDSGPVHLAAALGTPLVALFGPTAPARNGPWGPGRKTVLRSSRSVTSYKRHAVADPGLEQVSVDEVLAAAMDLGRPGL